MQITASLNKKINQTVQTSMQIEGYKPAPSSVAARIEELAELHDGWLDGKGLAPKRSALSWLAGLFEQNFAPDLPLPYLYPSADGGIQAEWAIGEWEITLDINLHKKTAEYQALHLATHDRKECLLDLSQQDGWQRLNKRLNQLHLSQHDNLPPEVINARDRI